MPIEKIDNQIDEENKEPLSYLEIKEKYDRPWQVYKLLSDETQNEFLELYAEFDEDEDNMNFEDYSNLIGQDRYIRLFKKVEEELNERKEIIKDFLEIIKGLNVKIVKKYFSQNFSNLNNNQYWKKNDFLFIQLTSGNFDFEQKLNLTALRKLIIEFKKLNIDPEAVVKKEEEQKLQNRIEIKKENKRAKKELIKELLSKLDYKRKLSSKILILLGINKIKNIKNLDNLKLDDIEHINNFYNKVEEQTKKLGGDVYDEDDLLLGLEELK